MNNKSEILIKEISKKKEKKAFYFYPIDNQFNSFQLDKTKKIKNKIKL